LVLTHDDGDHTGGATAVMRSVRVIATVVPPRFPAVPGPAARWPGLGVARGDTLGRTPRVTVAWPPRDSAGVGEPPIDRDNRGGLVLVVGEGGARAVLLADVDSLVERSLALEPGPAIVKVGHHGSGSSSGAAFLARLRPARAIVSCGRRNPFGHPDPGA